MTVLDSPFSLSSYAFNLPQELIAQKPVTPRDSSRLMVVDRASGEITEIVFRDLIDFLNPKDRIIFNDTKVIPARLYGKKESGGKVEMLLVRPREEKLWEVMAKPGKRLRPGAKVIFSDTFSAEIVDEMDNGAKVVSFDVEGDLMQALNTYGKVPLPHYITPESDEKANRERYQTIFAEHPGAVAAPTAGLHFTDEMFHALDQKEVEKMMVTLHVGPGTFRPVTVTDIRDHEMHYENYAVTADVARKLNERKDKQRSISVGTTCCRVLESAIGADGKFKEGSGDTGIFIYPGYNFKYVDCLLTNFHLPQSSLLMLVSALAGSDLIKEAYHKAVKEKFRFYSYGDAMLIL